MGYAIVGCTFVGCASIEQGMLGGLRVCRVRIVGCAYVDCAFCRAGHARWVTRF